ncbi:MAG: translesion error-prone DNA polymerase V autoproteolytic subunit [Bacteroidales bacterium]|nr:translesion error-prone DNA polymerase V autoproteolytic subunit [Bacteroidales bacterium]
MQEDIKIEISSVDTDNELMLPFEDAGIKAGFPSPAQDYMNASIDLNRELIRHKETTFYARVSGNSLIDAGIGDGDIIVIDKSLEATTGDYVVAFIDGEFTLKEFRLDEENKCAWLIPYNKDFSPIKVTQENDFMIWGIVTYVIKKMTKHF